MCDCHGGMYKVQLLCWAATVASSTVSLPVERCITLVCDALAEV
jgi:hypothetical protein